MEHKNINNMKKIAVILAFIATMNVMGKAQDTVIMSGPKSSYFHGAWAEGDTLMMAGLGLDPNYYDAVAVAYHSSDSLMVHGLAISLILEDDLNYYPNAHFQDTTMDSIYCYVRIYVPDADSLRVVGERRIHMRDTAVSYYLVANKRHLRNPQALMPAIPIYEGYLDQPIVVKDTFYVGFAYDKTRTYYDTVTHTVVHTHRYDIACKGFQQMSMRMKEPVTRANHYSQYYRSQYSDITTPWRFNTRYVTTPHLFMYAITAPHDSLSGGGGDTPQVAISENDMVARYVTVQPNPATNEARVLSSFGLTRIEAFDAGGRQVMGREATGVEATLDVTSWPRGTYLLRITTPLGTATKKLLVQ